MSEHEALARFRYWCAARHRKVQTCRLRRSRGMIDAQRSRLTTVLIRSGSRPEAGSILRHRSLTYRIVKEF
jgi:hypothetical protein